MVYLIIGIIIGFMTGAIGIYLAQQKKIKSINQKLQQTRRLLEESDAANRANANELEQLKREQDKIRQLQADQGSRQDELQRSYQEEIKQLEIITETKLQELESTYNNHLEALELERHDNLQKIEQYESQIQALIARIKIAEGEEDENTVEPVEKIESLLDLFLDLGTEPVTEFQGTTEAKIAAIAALNNASAVPQLNQYLYDTESKIRALVADTLGEIAEGKNQGLVIEQVIYSLGKLSRDADPTVRQSAVTALGKISSVNVIPLLKVAQRDTDSDVVKNASSALEKFKSYRVPQQKKSLPKNASSGVE
jgi:chromosome segregation ATPase